MGKIVKLTDQQLVRTLNVEMVNVSSFKQTFYKYMNCKRIKEMLNSKELVFVSPSMWNDPYESKYLDTDFTGISDYRQPPIFCTCVRNDNDNEEASWMIYKSPNDKLLKLSISVIPFIQSLGEFARNNNYTLYLSKVSYRFKKNEIDNLYHVGAVGYNEFFSDFNEKKYIELMSIKRYAFKYEHEYRLFFVPKPNCRYPQDGLLRVPIDMSSFIRFTMYPLPVEKVAEVRKHKEEEYKKEMDRIRSYLKKTNPKYKLYRSTLYDNSKKVKRIESTNDNKH